ncbi:hypothetical protein AA313_de0203978 [Arthrobotrys entomopaga]|nr:hypothetical protein AA313_de0203978 [Arthrobotrys entomopaga]
MDRYENTDPESSRVILENVVRERSELDSMQNTQGHSSIRRTAFGDFHEIGEELPYTQPRSNRAELAGYASPSGPWNNMPRSPPPQRNDTAGVRSPAPSMASSNLNTPFDSLSGFQSFPGADDTPGQTRRGSMTFEPNPQKFKPVESEQFLPAYVIDNFQKSNPDQDGFFCVFQKTYLLKSDGKTKHEGPLPSNQTSLWVPDQVIGHLFEVTMWGSLIYHGPFQDNDKEFVRYWGKRSTIKELENPVSEFNSFLWSVCHNFTAMLTAPQFRLPKYSNPQIQTSPDWFEPL